MIKYLKYNDVFSHPVSRKQWEKSDNQSNIFDRVTVESKACVEAEKNRMIIDSYSHQQNLYNNKTERLSRHSWENEMPSIPMKGFDFLRKPNPSCSQTRLNRRCLQSEEIPSADYNPVVFTRKRKPGLRRYSRALQPTASELEFIQMSPARWSAHMCQTMCGDRKAFFLFFVSIKKTDNKVSVFIAHLFISFLSSAETHG